MRECEERQGARGSVRDRDGPRAREGARDPPDPAPPPPAPRRRPMRAGRPLTSRRLVAQEGRRWRAVRVLLRSQQSVSGVWLRRGAGERRPRHVAAQPAGGELAG